MRDAWALIGISHSSGAWREAYSDTKLSSRLTLPQLVTAANLPGMELKWSRSEN